MAATLAQLSPDARTRAQGFRPWLRIAAGRRLPLSWPDSRLLALLLVFARAGAVPSGGKPSVIYQQDLVRRRGWLSREDYAESYALAKLLPGSTALNQVLFVGRQLHGRTAALACALALALPGLVASLLLGALLIGHPLPGWAAGALRGLVAATAGLHLSNTRSLLPAARSARLWPLFALGAFLATAVLKLDLLLVFLVLLPLALLLNRPRRPEGHGPC